MAIIKQHDKRTGITYVYESISYWDKEKQQSRAKRKLIGKIDPATGEMVPTRKKKSTPKADPQNTAQLLFSFRRQHFGAVDALQKISKKLKLDQGLQNIFPQDYRAILNLAYYLVLSPTSAVMHYPHWAKMHAVTGETLTSQSISKLFGKVSEHHKQSFFRWMLATHGEQEYWAYDTTTISSYSRLLPYIQYGYNKDHESLPQLNLALLYGEKTHLPFCYRELTGNLPDLKTIPWLLNQLEDMNIPHSQLVMDRGHYSKENIIELLKSGHSFIMGAKQSVQYIQERIKTLYDARDDIEKFDEDYFMYMHSMRVTDEFSASATSYYPITLHLYYQSDRASEETQRLDKLVRRLLNKVNRKEDLTELESKQVKRYLTKGKDGYQINKEVIQQKRKTMGWMALLTNTPLTSQEVLEIYRNKDVVEKAFYDIKDRFNLNRLRVSSEQSMIGKLFVQFIALILVSYIKYQMKKAKLFKEYTLEELLNQLNLIDFYVNDKQEYYIGEVTDKQRYLYHALGVFPPS